MGTSTNQARTGASSRWGDQQQVFYLLRPLPEALERKKNQSAEMTEGLPGEGSGLEERFVPYYGGVLRQQVSVPLFLPGPGKGEI